MTDFHTLTAADLIDGYASLQFSPVEVTTAALERARSVQATAAPFVEVLDQTAVDQARASERRYFAGEARPLDGLPIAIKDNVAIEGRPMTAGSAAMPDVVMETDATLVGRLRSSGAVFVGRTNCPEFCTLPATENARGAPTRNPSDLSKGSGGSSGGSAVAVAAGIVPVAHGNDGAGSLRIPGSACGVFAVKPTRGRITLGPSTGESPGGMIHEGFLARSVLDHARVMDAVAGPLAGDPSVAPPFDATFAELATRDPGRLRIALTLEPPLEVDVHPEAAAGARRAAELLAAAGHEVVEATVPWQDERLGDLFGLAWAVVIGWVIEELVPLGLDLDNIEPHNAALHRIAKETPVSEYFKVQAELGRYCRRVMSFWDDIDLVVTPTLSQPPIDIGSLFDDLGDDPLEPIARSIGFVPFTPVPNLTGQPAATLPLHVTDSGLPVGAQLLAGFGREDLIYQVSRQLEPDFVRPALAPELMNHQPTMEANHAAA